MVTAFNVIFAVAVDSVQAHRSADGAQLPSGHWNGMAESLQVALQLAAQLYGATLQRTVPVVGQAQSFRLDLHDLSVGHCT